MKDSHCSTEKKMPCPGKVLLKVAVGGLVIWAVGMVWYSDAVFGKAWMRLAGLDPEAVRQAMKAAGAKILGLSLLVSFLSSLVLHMLFCMTGATCLKKKLGVAVVASAGVIGTTLFSGVIWESKPVALFLLSVGYYLTAFLAVAVVSALLSRCRQNGSSEPKKDGCCAK